MKAHINCIPISSINTLVITMRPASALHQKASEYISGENNARGD